MAGLVGRDAELSAVRDLVTELARGRGRSVWVEGEPGVGKTALVTAALAEASQLGCQTFQVQADQSTRSLPLQLMLDLLQVRPGAEDPARAQVAEFLYGPSASIATPDQSATATAAELLVDLVQRWCAGSPLVLAADDLQWADELSLAVWGRLRRLTGQLPLLLVAATRPVPRRDEVVALRQALAEDDGLALRLGPLDPASVTELAGRLAGASPGPALAGLAAQAGGNPLYLEELLATLTREQRIRVSNGTADLAGPDTTAPASLQAAISARLEFLSGPARTMLRQAALLGTRLTVDQLTVVTGEPATALLPVLDEAMAAGVLADAGDQLAFRHGLIRQALVEATPASLRHAIHHQVAQALAAAGAPSDQVATQLLAAGPTTATSWQVTWALEAAPALVRRAPALAADLLQRIREATDDHAHRDQLATHQANALLALGRHTEVEQVARPVLDRIGDPSSAGPLIWTLGYCLVLTQRYEELRSFIDHMRDAQLLAPLWAARTKALRAIPLVYEWRADAALAAAAEAEADGRSVADGLTIGYALHVRSQAVNLLADDPATGLAAVDEALAVIGEDPETTDLRMLLLRNRAGMLHSLGRAEETDHAIAQLAALVDHVGSPTRQAAIRLAVIETYFIRGRWDDCAAELQEMAGLPTEAALWLRLRGIAALIALYSDDQATLAGQLEVDDADWTGYTRYAAMPLLIAKALVAERDRGPAEAMAGLLATFDLDPASQTSSRSAGQYQWLSELVRLAVSLGQRSVAELATHMCEAHAARAPRLHTEAAARHCRALCDADPSKAFAASRAYQQSRVPLFQAQALEDAAALCAEAGDTTTARTAYAEAVDLYTQLGAVWSLRRADARLRPHGIRRGSRGPRRRPTTGWNALTPTELKVARLVATGRSNPDIATQLYLSRRTVETHVSHILTKLNAHSRVDIARHATQATT